MHYGKHPYQRILLRIILLGFIAILQPASAVDVSAIGKIESLYQNRVSMRVLEVIGDASSTSPIEPGDIVGFDLPRGEMKNKRRQQIRFANIVKAELQGNIATEYEDTADESNSKAGQGIDAPKNVMLWTAKVVERVRNPRKWEPNKKKSGRQKKKEKQPPKIWTQEETVTAKVYLHRDRLYLKEARVGKGGKGLEILEPQWREKLTPLANQKIVTHGETHRVTGASGTMCIMNILKIYPK